MATKTNKSVKSGQNPYREGGSYHSVVATLAKLGTERMHPAAKVVSEYRKVVGPTAWKAFASKPSRNEETGKAAEARVIQNCIVVNRVDYGAPLREVGYEVRKGRSEGGYQFGLFAIKAAAKAASKPQAKPNGKGKANGKAKAAKR